MADLSRSQALSKRSVPDRPHLQFEQRYWETGITCVAGLDEAGRGALAGPVVAGAVVLSPNSDPSPLVEAGVRDSKQLSPRRREELYDLVCCEVQAWSYGAISASDIDEMGIVPATQAAMTLALQQLSRSPQALVIDYVTLPDLDLPQAAIVHGDSISLSVAAASIIAKVTRDRMLVEMEEDFPGYGFSQHKGYGTESHRQALRMLGPCPIHRLTFRPLSEAS